MNQTTSNSTPTGLPQFQQPSFGTNNFTLQTIPLMKPNLAPSTGMTTQSPVATVPQNVATPNVVQQYAPQVGPSTQKVADANYTNAITNAVSTSTPVPSTAITTGNTLAGAGATRSSYESLLQQYLDQQKQYQDRYLATLAPSAEEQALQKQLAAQKTQGALNQEQALASGETSSFAGGEAQRVARTDAIKQAGIAAQLDVLQNSRLGASKQIEALIQSGDNSFKNQLEIQKLQSSVNGIDKQAQDTFFNLSQNNPDVAVQYDATKTPLENLQELRKAIASKPGGLSPLQTQKEINTLVSNFRQEPIVKQYQTVATAISALNEAGTSPTDDIQRIYTFAKIMDPESAVREGEYSTIQDYATAYVEKLGLKANRIFNNQGFLTDEARKFMLTTLNRRYQQVEKSYNDLANQYGQNIESIKTGTVTSGLPNYSAAYTPSSSIGKKDYSAQDAQALRTINPKTGKNYTQAEIDAYKQQRGFSSVGSDTNPATSYEMTGLSNMQGLMGQLPPVDYTVTNLSNMTGLMQGAPVIQLAKVEIPKTSALSYANNNPGNLRFAGQDGAVKGKGGFARFNSPEDGLNALMNQIKLDASRGHTLSTFINKFAPPTENDTKLYIQQAMNTLGVTKDTPISQIPLDKLTKFVALKESSTKVN